MEHVDYYKLTGEEMADISRIVYAVVYGYVDQLSTSEIKRAKELAELLWNI